MSTERVGIVVEVQGGQEALNLMKNLQRAIDKLNGTKIKFDFGGKEIQAYVSATQQAASQADALTKSITRAKTETTSLGNVIKTTFNSVSSRMQHTGQMFFALGKSMERISTPMRTLFRSTVWAAGFKALDMAVSGLNGSFERYDIMKNYARSLDALGLDSAMKFKVGAGEAKDAINNLNDAVLGLPTGLDEIVAAQKVYAGATGEMVKSTKTAIAANNTFLASGMGSREQRFMQKYLVGLASGAELASNQWASMFRIAPLAMRAVAEELEYADFSKFREEVTSGALAGDRFLDAFIKVGTEGKVQAAANVMKTTWAGLAANTTNAFKRMGEGILSAFDEVFIGINGRNLIQNLLGFDAEGNEVGNSLKKIIDGISASIQTWIKANPEYFIDIMNEIKAFDWQALVNGIGKGLLSLADSFKYFMRFVSGKDVGTFGNTIRSIINFLTFGKLKDAENIGRSLALMPLISQGLMLLGNLLKGTKFLPAAIVALLKGAKVSQGAGGIFGIFGKIFGTKKSLKGIKVSTKEIPTVTQSLRKVVQNLQGVLTLSGTIISFALSSATLFWSLKTIMNNIKSISDVSKTIDWNAAKSVFKNLGIVFAGFIGVSAAFGKIEGLGLAFLKGGAIAGAFTAIFSFFAGMDMYFLSDAAASFKKLAIDLKKGLDTFRELGSVSMNFKNIENAIRAYNRIFEMFKGEGEYLSGKDGGEGSKLVADRKSAEDLKITVENLTETINQVARLNEIVKGAGDFSGLSDEIDTKLGSVFTALGSVYEVLKKKLYKYAKGKVSGELTTIMENTGKTFDFLLGEKGVLTQIEQLATQSSALLEADQTASILQHAKTGLKQVFEALGNIFEYIYGEKSFEGSKWLSSNVSENFSTTMSNIKNAFGSLLGEGGVFNQITKIATDASNLIEANQTASILQHAETGLKQIFESFGRIFNSIYGERSFIGSDWLSANTTDTTATVFENISNMLGHFIGDNGIIAKIGALSSEVEPYLDEDQGLSVLHDGLVNIITAFNDIFTVFNSGGLKDGGATAMSEAIGQLIPAMDSIRTIIEKLKGIGKIEFDEKTGSIDAIVGKIKGMVEQLFVAFNPVTIGLLSTNADLFITTVDNLLNRLSGMVGMSADKPMDIQITLNPTITGDKDTVSKIENAVKDINNAWSKVPTELSRNISVSISATVNTSGAISSINRGVERVRAYASTGGLIGESGKVLYRSKGGDVFGSIFKPKGKDLIPSMLSVGEFVQQKRAVDFWGIDFMRKVNKMDIRGVMSDLTTKAIQGVYGGTVVNNYYNNNQKVIQNIHTNSTDFAFRSASRFAGAF